MFCETYRETLTNAVAAGFLLGESAQTHVASCPACAAAFAEEQALFAGIENGLARLANAPVPPTLLPGVREAITQESVSSPRFRLAWTWLPAAVVAALALAAFLPRVLNRLGPQEAPVVAVREPSSTGGTISESRAFPQRRTAGPSPVHHSLPVLKATLSTPSTPEVLVSAQEEAALKSYVLLLQKRADLSQMLTDVSYRQPLKIEPLQISELTSKEIRIEPLNRDSDDLPK